MEARDRDDVVDAGGSQGVVRLVVDQPALPRHEGRRDGAGLPAYHTRDALRRVVARAVDESRHLQVPPGRDWRRDAPRRTQHRSDPAEAPEVSVAGEVVPAWTSGLRQRQDAGAALQEVAREEPARIPYGDPHPPGQALGRDALDRVHADREPRATAPLLQLLDETRELRDDDPLQDRSLDGAKPQDARGEAREDRCESDAGGQSPDTVPQGNRSAGGEDDPKEGRPKRRAPLGCEEKEHANRESDGDPREQSPSLDLVA